MKPRKPLERRLESFALHDLTLYLVGGQGIALVIGLTMPMYLYNLQMIPEAVLAGQWWRLLTFMFMPPSTNPIFAAFTLYFLYFMGTALESHWGALRYNLYVLIAYLVTIAAAFVFPGAAATNIYLTGSILLAFAWLYPDYQIFLFLVLPIRIKWLALFTWLGYAYEFVTGGWSTRLLVVAAVANFLVFFGRDIFYRARYGHRRLRQQTKAIVDRDKPLHICQVCGISDKTHRDMDFRYCSQCDPPLAYCTEHIRNHEHVRSAT